MIQKRITELDPKYKYITPTYMDIPRRVCQTLPNELGIQLRMIAVLLLSAAAFAVSEAVQCSQCFNYNGQVCVNSYDCVGNYCLFEELMQTNGVVTTKKTCMNHGLFQFDDGFVISGTNECVQRTTSLGSYRVKVCSDSNHCNNECVVLPPLPLTTSTLSPIVHGMITCYSCSTYDGTDCTEGSCQGNYCLYERRLAGNTMALKKSCLLEPVVVLDDGSPVETIDVCEVRNSADATYYVKMCQDAPYCNGYCNPGVTSSPQRQPLVNCYDCESSSGDCTTGSCQAEYCIYEKQQRSSTGSTYVRKGCTAVPNVQYPDNSYTNSVNACEQRTIGDVLYSVKVCNTGAGCNSECQVNPGSSQVTCTQCQATNQTDCSGGTCTGKYCLFDRQVNSITGASVVKKSCTNSAEIAYPDGSSYQNMGHCEFKIMNGNAYALKVCNSKYCNTPCAATVVSSTQSPLNGSTANMMFLTRMITLLFVLKRFV